MVSTGETSTISSSRDTAFARASRLWQAADTTPGKPGRSRQSINTDSGRCSPKTPCKDACSIHFADKARNHTLMPFFRHSSRSSGSAACSLHWRRYNPVEAASRRLMPTLRASRSWLSGAMARRAGNVIAVTTGRFAAGNSSVGNSGISNQRTGWPSRPEGSPCQAVTSRKCRVTCKSSYWWAIVMNGEEIAACMPSSSSSSRARAIDSDSPGSTLPPGNSQHPP